jgi:hypothetical protein
MKHLFRTSFSLFSLSPTTTFRTVADEWWTRNGLEGSSRGVIEISPSHLHRETVYKYDTLPKRSLESDLYTKWLVLINCEFVLRCTSHHSTVKLSQKWDDDHESKIGRSPVIYRNGEILAKILSNHVTLISTLPYMWTVLWRNVTITVLITCPIQ